MACGADRARTDDLLNAIQTLSQLSYGPLGNMNLKSYRGSYNKFLYDRRPKERNFHEFQAFENTEVFTILWEF